MSFGTRRYGEIISPCQGYRATSSPATSFAPSGEPHPGLGKRNPGYEDEHSGAASAQYLPFAGRAVAYGSQRSLSHQVANTLACSSGSASRALPGEREPESE